MVFSRQQRDPLLPGLNSGDSGCFLDTVSQGAAEVREEFYDTLFITKWSFLLLISSVDEFEKSKSPVQLMVLQLKGQLRQK